MYGLVLCFMRIIDVLLFQGQGQNQRNDVSWCIMLDYVHIHTHNQTVLYRLPNKSNARVRLTNIILIFCTEIK